VSVSRELLMRYHDGEVSDEEARFVAHALEHEPALLEELAAYTELGSFVRVFAEQRLPQQPFDISERVMRAIEPPKARVHSLLPRLATWVSLGVAIAAGSVLVVRSWSAPPAPAIGAHTGGAGESAELMPRSSSSAAPEVSAALEEEPKPPPATIESVDFGANTGTVFVVSTDSSDTPVVWMPDDGEPDADDEDRSESL
jgi:negative regulator of sigma E activity